jgi:hypothetical protein
LVSATAVVMQAGRLRISTGLKLAPVLAEELANFKMKINLATGHDPYESWRERVHDDCVLSVVMGLWLGERPMPASWSDLGAAAWAAYVRDWVS